MCPQQKLKYPNHVVTPATSAYAGTSSAVSYGLKQALVETAVPLSPVSYGKRDTQRLVRPKGSGERWQEKWYHPIRWMEKPRCREVNQLP